MATKIYILGEVPLWSGGSRRQDVLDLHQGLNDLLQDAGEVIWDGDEHSGLSWSVDLLLYDDADIEAWLQRFVSFFRNWGVLDRTLTFTIIRDGAGSRWEHRRIELPTE